MESEAGVHRGALAHDERPWGAYTVYASNEPCTVKIITVRDRQRLSLQRHARRDELWVVLDGGLHVEIDGDVTAAEPGQEFFVPRGATHRVSCAGVAEARFLEVAFGEFDEDDIERLEDDYGRTPRADEGGAR